MKKILALALIALLLLSLFAGCQNETSPESSGSKPSSAAANSTGSNGGGEKTVIRMAVMTGMQEYFTLADNYMAENPNVVIEIEEYPTTEFSVLLKAKLAGGDCWDVLSCTITEQPTLAAGHLADLSDMSDVIDRYESPEMVRNTRTYDGIMVALPAQYQFMPLYYNKALFNELGLDVPTDWQQLLAMVEKAKGAGLTPIAAGFKENWMCVHWILQIAATSVQRDDIDWGEKRHRGEVTFAETEGWATAYDKLKEIIAAGAFSDSAVSTSDEQAMMAFLNGESLCYFNGTWGLNAMLSAQPEGFVFGGTRLPVNDPGEEACTSTSVTGDFAVWAKSPNVEEAKKWLAFTLSPEQNLIFNSTKGPSPFRDVNVPLHEAFIEFEQQVAASGGKVAEWPLFQQRWPDGMPYPEPMFPMIQELFYPDLARETTDILKAMDEAWDEATGG